MSERQVSQSSRAWSMQRQKLQPPDNLTESELSGRPESIATLSWLTGPTSRTTPTLRRVLSASWAYSRYSWDHRLGSATRSLGLSRIQQRAVARQIMASLRQHLMRSMPLRFPLHLPVDHQEQSQPRMRQSPCCRSIALFAHREHLPYLSVGSLRHLRDSDEELECNPCSNPGMEPNDQLGLF